MANDDKKDSDSTKKDPPPEPVKISPPDVPLNHRVRESIPDGPPPKR